MKCHADPARNSCEVLVTKILVDCGHTAKLPCSNVNFDFKCQQKVSLVGGACGHRYQIACHEDSKTYQRENLCQELVTKTFLCMHVEEVMCRGSRYANCIKPCTFQCHHGHSCSKLCHFQTPCKCEFLVEKILPKCGHQLLIECHSEDDPAWLQVPCEEIVSKVIPLCGHSQNMKCKESPQTQQCQEIVPKKHPLCGHMIAMMCSLTPSRSMLCKTIVHKTLVCGHKQDQECSARNVTCTVNVLKTIPCGHQQLVPCNKMDAPVTCMKRITKKFQKCGHVTEMFCWASALYLHCLQTLTLTKCGHQKTVSCEENMHGVEMEKAERLYKCKLTCFTEVTLHFACGHSETTQCHLSETVRQCSKGCCPHILSCGHHCTGKDDDCSKKLFHAYCTQPCNKLLVCGHHCKSATCGLCSICSNECERYCPHRKCEHPCSQDCPPCKETCSLQCPHHNCSRLCHEECNRPPCNLRCPLMLKCSHPCMGYCGEPCPRLCIVCEPDRRNEFTQTCNEDIRLVRLLDCGHEHDASLLDKLLKEDTENGFSVLRCPSCDKVMHWHPRYSHQLKQQWHAIDAVKKILLSCLKGCTKQQRFPMVAGGVSDIRTYLRRLSTFLYLNENLNTDKNHHIKWQEWLRYTIQSLSAFLDDLPIATRSSTFTQSDLSKFRELLLPFLTDSSEAIQSLDCPELRGVSIHLDDWTRCIKGHVRPSSYAGDNCLGCSSGTKWTVEMLHLMKEIRNQIASKKVKDKDGNTRSRQESRQQLEQSTGLEPYVATLGEFTAGPDEPQSQFMSQFGDKRRTVKNRYLGTEDDDLWETKNNLGTGDFDLRETEGNWGTGDVGTRVADRNWRTGKVEPRATDINWRTGKAEPRATERNWRKGKAEPRATERNWRTGKAEPRVTEGNWRPGKAEPRVTEGN
ncbi:NFX1-type zinc finger-containing protein 1 [Mizuhopecten yessoensis]|uniref:NFX1-type zinc finger-containing protein 1 n=1 Tax=Mizuhopecten yessoensis TaxID=6573 RepID=A0A210PHJ6_MIZYE|nr:NFX1-type zinc finger-containing protein 1 [Mizuhopecten yessoensis]